MSDPIAFIDLAAQRRRLGPVIDAAVLKVIDHGAYIMGPEVDVLEANLAEFCGAKHVISCSNGTDALSLVLMAKGVRAGDAVLCPSFTFAATAESVVRAGATPIFIDVQETTFNLDIDGFEAGLKTARDLGLNPIGVIPVDLFGQPADYAAIETICAREGMWILSDAAQSFGATYKGRRVGTIGLATTTSFFPAKPLGCYGDGGGVFTDDDNLAAIIRSLRVHGLERSNHVRVGITGRLDTIQAAVLIQKLKIFPDEIIARDRVAKRYNRLLSDVAIVPELADNVTSVWAQYTLRLPGLNREEIQAEMKANGIPTAVHYAKPLHLHEAYGAYPVAGKRLPVSERLAAEVMSLPMHAYLSEGLQDRIVAALKGAIVFQERILPGHAGPTFFPAGSASI